MSGCFRGLEKHSWVEKSSFQGTFIHLLESKVSVGCFLRVLFVELIGVIKTIVFRQNTNKYNKVVKKKKSRFSTETKFNLPGWTTISGWTNLLCCEVELYFLIQSQMSSEEWPTTNKSVYNWGRPSSQDLPHHIICKGSLI